MRRNAGSFVRGKLLQSSVLGAVGAGMALGVFIGLLFYSFDWGVIAYIVTVVVLLSAVRFMDLPSYRWNLGNLQKGAEAEVRVGQIIEYAITGENCAIAHSVTEIAKVGDIDHIVATPKGIWVIETKYKRVPKESFRGVLSRIAANTVAVRQWAPAESPVRGCLVLAYEKEIKRRKYSYGKEEITVFTPERLMREMRREARGKRSLDERIVKDIWKLGHITE